MLAGEAASKLKVLTWRHISLLPSQAPVFVLIVWYLFPHFYTLERLTQSWLLLYELEIWRLFYSLCGRSFPFCEESSQNTALFGTRRQISPPGWTGLWAASFTVAVSQPQNDLNWKSDTANRRSVSLKGFCKQQGSRWLPTGWTIHLLPTCGCICRSCSWKTS